MLKHIPIEQIERNQDQPRKTFPEASLHELAASIKQNGLLQPITVRLHGKSYQIVSGERRWRAHQLLGAKTVLSRVVNFDDAKTAVAAIIENLQREDVRPSEEAHAICRMLELGYSERELADMLGISAYRVRQKASLTELDEQIKKLVDTDQITVWAGFEIAKLPRMEQRKLVGKIGKGGVRSLTDIRALVESIIDKMMQGDMFVAEKKATEGEMKMVRDMESRVDAITRVIAEGWNEGECTIARKVAPDRVRVMAEKCALLRMHLRRMERQLKAAAAQADFEPTL